VRHCDVAPDLGRVQVCLVAATVEDRQHDLRRERPAERAAAEQSVELAAGGADAGGQRDAWIKGCTRGADIGVGRQQLLFGCPHVGPAQQHVAGQAARNDTGQSLVGQ